MKKLFVLLLFYPSLMFAASTFDGSAFTKFDGIAITKFDGLTIDGDVTAPTVSTAIIGTNGTTLTLGMSETVTRTSGTFDVDCATAGNGITAIYSSGSGSSSLVYTLGTTVKSGDTCNLDYNGTANGIEDGAGNDLAAITDKEVTNNSTQSNYIFNETFAGSIECYSGFSSVCDTAWGYASGVTFASGSLTADADGEHAQYFFTASDSVYVAAKIRWSAGSTSPAVLVIQDGSNNVLCDAEIYQNTQFGVTSSGGTQQFSNQVFSNDTDYDIKIYAAKGTGANAQAKVAWSPSGTNSWTWTTLSNDGTWTAQPERISISGYTGNILTIKRIAASAVDINF